MSRIYIRIANITIALFSEDPTLKLQVEGAMEKFLVTEALPDVNVRVGWDNLAEKEKGKKVFDSGSLWQLYSENGTYRFRFVSPAFGILPYKVACFNRDFTSGEVSLHRSFFETNHPLYPLEYPLDELLMLNLLAKGRGGEVHGCGVVDTSGNGYLFVGQSGAGKTTMARLWLREERVKILSDDRIILRKIGDQFWMYGTPWHGEAKLACSARAPLTQIFFLRHGKNNERVPQKQAEATARLFACSFPPFYSRDGLDFTLSFFEEVTNAVPCWELRFIPDHTVVSWIQQERFKDFEHYENVYEVKR